MPEPAEIPIADPHRRGTRRPMLTGIFLGVVGCVALAGALYAAQWTARDERTLGCQRIAVAGFAEDQEYCVHYRGDRGLFGISHTLSIGRAPDRGLRFSVPFAPERIEVRWNSGTEEVTIAMPGATLTVGPEAYVDRR